MTRVEIARNKIQWIKSKIKEETDPELLVHLASVGIQENTYIITRRPQRPETPVSHCCVVCKKDKPPQKFGTYVSHHTKADGTISTYSYRRKTCTSCRNARMARKKRKMKKATSKDKFIGY